MKIIGKIYIETWAEFIYRHGLLVEIKSKHPVHKTLKTEYIVQASIPCPWRAGWGSLHCISQISKLLYRNYVSYVKTLSGTRQKPQLPSTCCQDLGRGCCSDTLQKEGVHLTTECLHKVEMSAQFDMALLNTLPEQFCIIRSWTYSPLELENIISKLWPLASASLVSQKILRSLLVAESSSVISWLPEPERQQPSRAQVGQTDLLAHPASLLPLPFLSRRPGYLTLSTVII